MGIKSIIYIFVLFIINTSFKRDIDNKIIGNWEYDFYYNLQTKQKNCLYLNPDSSINLWAMSIEKKSFKCTIDCNPLLGKYKIQNDKISFNWEKLFDYSDVCDEGKNCLNPSLIKSKMKHPSKFEIVNDTILNIYFDSEGYYSFIKF